jgi:hypothetical protein
MKHPNTNKTTTSNTRIQTRPRHQTSEYKQDHDIKHPNTKVGPVTLGVHTADGTTKDSGSGAVSVPGTTHVSVAVKIASAKVKVISTTIITHTSISILNVRITLD